MRIDDSSIRVDRHKCIACGICVDRCIMDNLRLSVAPCRQACPVGMNCQGYIRLIAMGEEKMAVEQLSKFGPLLPLIASNCSAPCENACTRKKMDGAVHILELKRYIAKKYINEFEQIKILSPLSGKTVLIIGTGLSGLVCGVIAIQSGHNVNFYPRSGIEQADEGFKKIITALENAGAVFLNQSCLKTDADLINQADAVVLSGYNDKSFLDFGAFQINAEDTVDPVSHQLKEKIFCSDIGLSKKGMIFQIAQAFETSESANRFLNDDDQLTWGRGLYSQGGAVKAFKPDLRVGSDDTRLTEKETGFGFDKETAKKQASRCFGCGRAFEKNQTCWYCLPCELECPTGALTVEIPYLVR